MSGPIASAQITLCKYKNINKNKQLRHQHQDKRNQIIWDIPVNIQQRLETNQRFPILISRDDIREILQNTNTLDESIHSTETDDYYWSISSSETAIMTGTKDSPSN